MHTRCTRTTAVSSPWSPPAYGSRASLYTVDRHEKAVNLGIDLASHCSTGLIVSTRADGVLNACTFMVLPAAVNHFWQVDLPHPLDINSFNGR